MPVIRITDNVMKILKQFAIPFEDTPNTVLQRILNDYIKLKSKEDGCLKVESGGDKMPVDKESRDNLLIKLSYRAEKYGRWIYEALTLRGGSAEAKWVISHIEKTHIKELSEEELGDLICGVQRSTKNTNFARLELKEHGLLNKYAPHGIWELTEKGKNYFEIQKSKPIQIKKRRKSEAKVKGDENLL